MNPFLHTKEKKTSYVFNVCLSCSDKIKQIRMGGLKSLARGLNKQAKLNSFRDSWYAAKHKEHPEKTLEQIWEDYWFECDLAANKAGLRD